MPMTTARIAHNLPGLPESFRCPHPVRNAQPPAETTVVVLTGELTGTGRQKSSIDLTTGLGLQGYQAVLLAHPHKPVPAGVREQLEGAGARLQTFAPGRTDFGRTPLRLGAALRALRPDVLVEYSADALPFLNWGRKSVGNPRLIFANRNFCVPSGPLGSLVARALQRVDAIACVSAAVASYWTLAAPYLDQSRLWVTYNGVRVPPAEAYPAPAAARAALGLPAEARILGTIGRMVRGKGQEFLIRALPDIVASVPETLLVMAGSGPYEPALRELAATLGVADQTHFLGWREDIPQILPAFDVFAHTPTLETHRQPRGLRLPDCPALGGEACGRTLPEAMAASLPIIATDSGGNAELVLAGETGYLAGAENVAAIAEAAVKLLSRPDEARRMGQAGRERAVAEFSLEALGLRYHYLIQTLLGAQPAPST